MAIGPMSEAERYRFDLHGFLVRRGVLGAGDVAALHAAIDVLDLPRPGPELGSQRFNDHLPIARRFRDLIDHAAVLEIVRETCGPNVRLDHAYGIVMSPGTSGLGLHGGGDAVRRRRVLPRRRRADPHRARRRAVGTRRPLRRARAASCASPAATRRGSPCRRRSTATSPSQVPLAAGDVIVFSEALDPRHAAVAVARGAAHPRLQVLARQLGVVAGRLAAGSPVRVHRSPASLAAAAERRPPPTRRAVGLPKRAGRRGGTAYESGGPT